MKRATIYLAGTAGALGALGCANTWERLSAKSFWEAPIHSTFGSDDPMTVLRTKSDGNARIVAMNNLQEPATQNQPTEVQDEALQMLGIAATTSPSPVIRTAAIAALGRFKDPRAVTLLIAAYHRADGTAERAEAAGDIQQARATASTLENFRNPSSLNGPVGFETSFITTLRSRIATALANTQQPAALKFLATIATTKPASEDPTERDVRAAAVRGLGQMRSQESVAVLAAVLKAEHGKDVVIAGHAHDGLMALTGKTLPEEPKVWADVVQAGAELPPAPNAVQRAIHYVVPK